MAVQVLSIRSSLLFFFFFSLLEAIFFLQIMISVIVIAVLVAVDLKIIFLAPSNNFSCVNLFLFDSDIFKRIH